MVESAYSNVGLICGIFFLPHLLKQTTVCRYILQHIGIKSCCYPNCLSILLTHKCQSVTETLRFFPKFVLSKEVIRIHSLNTSTWRYTLPNKKKQYDHDIYDTYNNTYIYSIIHTPSRIYKLNLKQWQYNKSLNWPKWCDVLKIAHNFILLYGRISILFYAVAEHRGKNKLKKKNGNNTKIM